MWIVPKIRDILYRNRINSPVDSWHFTLKGYHNNQHDEKNHRKFVAAIHRKKLIFYKFSYKEHVNKHLTPKFQKITDKPNHHSDDNWKQTKMDFHYNTQL